MAGLAVTSLILLLKIGDRRLLFSGDAQIENWSYAFKEALPNRTATSCSGTSISTRSAITAVATPHLARCSRCGAATRSGRPITASCRRCRACTAKVRRRGIPVRPLLLPSRDVPSCTRPRVSTRRRDGSRSLHPRQESPISSRSTRVDESCGSCQSRNVARFVARELLPPRELNLAARDGAGTQLVDRDPSASEHDRGSLSGVTVGGSSESRTFRAEAVINL